MGIIEFELGYAHQADGDRSIHSTDRHVMRFTMVGFWVFSVVFLCLRYYYKRAWQNLPIPKEIKKRVYSNDYTNNTMRQNRVKGYFSTNFLIDIIILTIQPLPLIEFKVNVYEYLNYSPPNEDIPSYEKKFPGEYLFSDFLLLFMFLRIYILIRSIFNHSQFSDPYAKQHCDRYGFTANSRFVFK